MEHSCRSYIYPWFSIGMGIGGFFLQYWLFSNVEQGKLLPEYHLAGLFSVVLLFLVFMVNLVVLRHAPRVYEYEELFPGSLIAALGSALAAFGMGYAALDVGGAGVLELAVPVFGILSAAALLCAAYCRLSGKQPSCLFHCVVVVYLLLRTISRYRTWGSLSQIALYFFPLVAALLLLLATYYRAELDIHTKNYKKYLFFSQAALFCCFLCLVSEDWIFYLSAGLWIGTDYCVLPVYQGRHLEG